jgi:Mg2+ and Co2+ transporter CorA
LTVFSTIFPFPNVISSIWGTPFSFSISFSVLELPYILVSISKSSCSLTM